MKSIKLLSTAMFVVCVLMAGTVATAQDSTWDVIQHEILQQNCSDCHQAGTSFARQSELLLTPDQAYRQLVDELPANDAARADGLMRVSSTGGQPGLAQSFLWEKINAPEQEHFYEDHPDYGAFMPLGAPPLTNGQLDFMKGWILAGAPEYGSIVDLAVLDDTSRYEAPEFEPLAPPEHGVQLHVGPFDVWSAEKHDREFYYFEPHATEQDMLVNAYEVSYREGSHHFILNHYAGAAQTPPPQTFRDLRDAQGTPLSNNNAETNHSAFVVATQVPHFRYEFPEDVALRLPPGSGFDLNVHSVNRTDETRQGEVYVNLETSEPNDVLHVADSRLVGNFDINLPPHQTTTLTWTYTVPELRNIVQMWSHAHEHMVEFRVEYAGGERDGELLYWSNDWEHPPVLEFDPPLVLEKGEQIRLVTTYDNQTDISIGYGPLSSDEMQFLYYVSYPLTGDFRGDGVLDVVDIDTLSRRIALGRYTRSFDINYDGALDNLDRVRWVERLMNTHFGDANLDGSVGFDDFLVLSNGFGAAGGWGDGDFDGSGTVDFPDFLLLSDNFGRVSAPAVGQVPEPSSVILTILSVLALPIFRRRRAGNPKRQF